MPTHRHRATIVDALRSNTDSDAEHLVFRYLLDGEARGRCIEWSRADLERQARRIAARLNSVAAPGDRALLVFGPGLEFVAALFGCFMAGVIAVPTYPPDPRQMARSIERLARVAEDSDASLILADEMLARNLDQLRPRIPALRSCALVATDTLPFVDDQFDTAQIGPETIAYLQYTSGSTGHPRGVVVRHRNIIANILGSTHMRAGPGRRSVVWTPLYHDLGLVAFVLSPVYLGFESTLMSPLDFLRRPSRWVEALSHFRATHTAAPSFGFDLVVRKTPPDLREALDLSELFVAGAGAEPVRAGTIDRFAQAFATAGLRKEAIQPTYGLAESVLYASFKQQLDTPARRVSVIKSSLDRGVLELTTSAGGDIVEIVSCGRALPDHRLRVVDPETLRELPDGHVGEIWLAGPSIADGYWRDTPEAASPFGASLPTDPGHRYLRTGDLGALVEEEIYIVGRMKDLIILGGRNIHPHDLENTAELAHPAIRPGCAGAVALVSNGIEGAAVVAETREGTNPQAYSAIVESIRDALQRNHEVVPLLIALVSPETLPKTSSGKLRRGALARSVADGTLAPLATWRRSGADAEEGASPPDSTPSPSPTSAGSGGLAKIVWELPPSTRRPVLLHAVISAASAELGLAPGSLSEASDLARFGLDSMRGATILGAIEQTLELRLPQELVIEAPTLGDLVDAIEEARARGRDDSMPRLRRRPRGGDLATTIFESVLLEAPGGYNPGFNLFGEYKLQGRLDEGVLEHAFSQLMTRHEAFRYAYVRPKPGAPYVRRIVGQVDFAMARTDLRALGEAERALTLVSLKERVRGFPYDVGAPPLFCVHLVRTDDATWHLLIGANHLIMDGWSTGVLLGDLGEFYRATAEGRTPSLPQIQIECSDYAPWDKEVLEATAVGRAGELARPPEAVEVHLPTDRPLPASLEARGLTHRFVLGEDLRERLDEWARRKRHKLSTLLVAAVQNFVQLVCDRDRIRVNLTTPNRVDSRVFDAVGFFAGAVTLRNDLSDGDLDRLLAANRRQLTTDYDLERLRTVATRTAGNLVILNYHSWRWTPDLPGVETEFLSPLHEQRNLWFFEDLTIDVHDDGARLHVSFFYRREIFDAATIERFATRFVAVIEHIAQTGRLMIRA